MIKLYKIDEIEDASFYILPKSLFTETYKNLSLESKVLYAFLRDRMELSRKNNWVLKDGTIYLIFTREEMAVELCCSVKTVINAIKNLDKFGLIKEKRQGLNKPNLIFIGHIGTFKTCKIYNSRLVDFTSQDMKNLQPNDTNRNKTEKKETENKNRECKDTSSLCFKEMWDIYPHRVGDSKPQTLSNWNNLVKNGIMEDQLLLAAKNYAAVAKMRDTPREFCVSCSNFYGRQATYSAYINVDLVALEKEIARKKSNAPKSKLDLEFEATMEMFSTAI